jgi:hypothetical protein
VARPARRQPRPRPHPIHPAGAAALTNGRRDAYRYPIRLVYPSRTRGAAPRTAAGASPDSPSRGVNRRVARCRSSGIVIHADRLAPGINANGHVILRRERTRRTLNTIQGKAMIVATYRGALAPASSAAHSSAARSWTCHHVVPCPAATAPDRHAARTVATHPEQGWSLLCNGVILFDDDGELVLDAA